MSAARGNSADSPSAKWKPTGRGGTLTLATGVALRVRATEGRVTFAKNALELEGTLPDSGTSEGIRLEIVHRLKRARKVHVPHLTPAPQNVAGDFVFRSPAVIVADERVAIALVPNLGDVQSLRGLQAWIDYDHPARTVTFAAGGYRHDGHVFFVREPVACIGQSARLRLHVLSSDKPADLANPWGMVARFLWRRYGRALHAAGGSQRAPLSRYMEYVVRWAFSPTGWGDEVWQSFELEGKKVGAPVFIVDVTRHPSVPPEERRWREPRSIWNQAWFSTQRCANGLFHYASQIDSADLRARATQMTELALAAPQRDGLFPSIVKPLDDERGWSAVRWTNSDRRPRTVSEEACHIVDAAFTSRMLLEWARLTADERATDYARRFADRLVRLQLPSGAFPGWVEADGRIAEELREGPESAVSVSLLFELGSAYRDAAMAGASFLRGVIEEARWEDFETYWSCAPWGCPELLGKRVPRNGVFKQNTLSIAWCAEAMLCAARATKDKAWLRLARRLVDELSLYQAVWDPPFLPAPAHGGFGVMNADSEWNDARQSLFAPIYLDLYRETGDLELFERGLSALRASFSMLYCPENDALTAAYERRFPFFGPESFGFMMENQAHSGGDPIGTFTIFTWGNGSALATAATIRDRFGDLFTEPPLELVYEGSVKTRRRTRTPDRPGSKYKTRRSRTHTR